MAPTRGRQSGTYLTSPYQVEIAYGNNRAGIVQNSGADWFGPLNPISPIAPPEIAGRQWDFPSGYNLNTVARTYEPISFVTLRELADAYDILRLVIETRKDQVARMEWKITARDQKQDVKGDERVATATAFFARPNRWLDWPDWLRLLLEDLFVLDAPAIFCQRTRSGDLFALHPLDGATIKPVIDDWGRRPLPYSQGGKTIYPVAYQQILKGYPAVDYSVRDLVYRPRNIRVNRAYGFGAVEQIINTVNTGLRRELFTLDYFTEGTTPDSIITVPETWTPDQITAYQKHWDSYFGGDLGRRRKVKFTPGGTGNKVTQLKEPALKGDFDEWLVRIVCYAFSVSPQAFTRMMNRATAETQKELSEDEGLRPVLKWLKSVMDRILEEEFDAPDLEFTWQADETPDEAAQAIILEGYTSKGIMTINEARDRLGMEPLMDDAANKPMVLGAAGYIPIDANTIEGKQANIDAFGPQQSGQIGYNGAPPINEGQDGDAAKPEVGKAADLPFLDWAPAGTVSKAYNGEGYPESKAPPADAIARFHILWSEIFRRLAASVKKQIAATVSKVAPSDKEAEADRIIADLDLDLTDDEKVVLEAVLAEVATNGGFVGIDEVVELLDEPPAAGIRTAMFGRVNGRAVAWAADHSAELVSDIDDATRNMLRDQIASSMSEGKDISEIADDIASTRAFSDDRAALIAENEVATANSYGALDGYRVAAESGVRTKKSWLTGAGACPICRENAVAGAIELDEAFPSGDQAPTAHPRCRCAISPVVIEDGLAEKAYNPNQPRDARGRWTSGGGSGPAKTPEELGRRILYGLPGVSVAKSQIEGSGDFKDGAVDLSVRDGSNKQVARVSRLFNESVDGKKIVTHDYFKIDNKSLQGQGLAKQLLKNSMVEYKKLGIDAIELQANIDVGGYAWARYGFVPTQESWANLRTFLGQKLDGMAVSDAQYDRVKSILASDDPTSIRDLAGLRSQVATNSGYTKLGKALLLKTNWYGSLDLSDDRSMRIFNAYVRRQS